MAALREQDYEAYLRLARTAKDRRLRTLLDKTDGIISELGLKARSFPTQKGQAGHVLGVSVWCGGQDSVSAPDHCRFRPVKQVYLSSVQQKQLYSISVQKRT